MRTHPRDNFYYLLAGLLTLIMIGPVVNELLGELGTAVMELSFSVMLLLALGSLQASRRWFVVGAVLIVLNLLFTTGALMIGNDRLFTAAMSCSLFFCLIATWGAATQVFRTDRVDLNTVVGAVCVYLLLGVIWAILYHLLGGAVPDSFTGLQQYEGSEQYWRYFYFSFVTLTTLGYGDVSPINAYAETLVVLEAVVGQMYLTVLIAGLVGAYLSDRMGPQPSIEGQRGRSGGNDDSEPPPSARKDTGTAPG